MYVSIDISAPHWHSSMSRPMAVIGPTCHELRIPDETVTWRIIYRTDSDAIVIAEVFAKSKQQTPERVIAVCKTRSKRYDSL